MDTHSGAYFQIAIIQSVFTFVIARIFFFSRMKSFLFEYKLIVLNKELDKRVVEKTKKLTESNKALKDEIVIRKRYQKNLTEAKKKAEESDMLKSTFLANMSHEIRTPMNGILGFAELLTKRELGQEKTTRYLNLIHSNSKQLLVIIDDILDISKIEANQLEVYPEKIAIVPYLNDRLDFFSETITKIQKKSLVIKLEIPENSDDTQVVADPIRLNQILNNLIKNAIKFTEKGSISFGYKQANHKTTFFVKDTGIGIPPSKIDFVFNRFNQIDGSSIRAYGGTGLGLTISKGLVELMGGAIWCESELNKGSTFYFTIPDFGGILKKDKVEQPYMDGHKQVLARSTVLVVEDDYTSFNLIKEYLEEYNVKIIHAINGYEAVEFCSSNPEISIVLMDVQMTGMDGLQATELIKKCRDDLPVIAQTAGTKYTDKEDIWDDVILKPINENELLTKLINNIPKD